jgi:lipoic acid synthetase
VSQPEAAADLHPLNDPSLKPVGAPRERLAPWLKKRLPSQDTVLEVKALMEGLDLHTVCRSARCPNLNECWSRKAATFMILGDLCTRTCRFCTVPKGKPLALDPAEPEHVAEAAERMGLRHVVVTSVDRDDLADQGAGHFAATIAAVRRRLPDAVIEVLTPDFRGVARLVDVVSDARPQIYNHNLETVPRLYRRVRPGAGYRRSLALLQRVKQRHPEQMTKSGLMLGLGESRAELLAVLADLRAAGVDILTLGQYLRPTLAQLPVERFVPPAEFDDLAREARALGFLSVASAPFVRSSYNAAEVYAALGAAGGAGGA